MDPSGNENPRRHWVPMSIAGTRRRSTQPEQRIVDVAQRETLSTVHALPAHHKTGWPSFLDELTLRSSWFTVSQQIASASGPPDEQSGYFWASILAAASGALHAGGAVSTAQLTAQDVQSFVGASSGDFKNARYPVVVEEDPRIPLRRCLRPVQSAPARTLLRTCGTGAHYQRRTRSRCSPPSDQRSQQTSGTIGGGAPPPDFRTIKCPRVPAHNEVLPR